MHLSYVALYIPIYGLLPLLIIGVMRAETKYERNSRGNPRAVYIYNGRVHARITLHFFLRRILCCLGLHIYIAREQPAFSIRIHSEIRAIQNSNSMIIFMMKKQKETKTPREASDTSHIHIIYIYKSVRARQVPRTESVT